MIKTTDFAACVTDYFTRHLAGVKNLSSNTISSYRDTFCLLLVFLSEEVGIKAEKTKLSIITDKTISDFLEWLENSRGNAISTRNVRLAAIHAFYRFVQMQHPELLTQCQRILAIPLKKAEKKTVNYLSEDTLKELLSQPDQSDAYGIRDTAILCLLYDSGARVQEIIDLSVSDVRLEALPTVRLLGKGRKVRIIPIMSQTAGILQKYSYVWNLDNMRRPDEPLFVNHQGHRLTRPGITYILKKYVEQIPSQSNQKPITPHIIRHSKAMDTAYTWTRVRIIRPSIAKVCYTT